MRAALLGAALALQLVLPKPPCEKPAPEWRGLVGSGPLAWPGGSLRLVASSNLNCTAEFAVEDTSPLRRSEVVDVVLPGRARRSATGVLVDSWVGWPAVQRLAVVAETEDSVLAVEDPPLYDTRVVYSAFVEQNKTWVLVARVRVQSLTPAACEAPFVQEAALEGPGLTSVQTLPGYPSRLGQDWDFNCTGVPQQLAVAWEKQLEFAVKWAGEEFPDGVCLPAGHWHWDAPEAEWAFAELEVLRTAPMTFYVPLGFSGGYFGVQDHDSSGDAGTRFAVFSVWDQAATAEVVELGAGVEARRFDGELRGFQLVRPLRWAPEEKLRFLVRVDKSEGAEPLYSAYLYEKGEWGLVGTIRVRPCGLVPFAGLGALNSFIEVFNLKDCESHREAKYSVWTKGPGTPWEPVQSALLSGTGVTGLRGRVVDNSLTLDVGGDLTENVTVSLFSIDPPQLPPMLEAHVPLPGSRSAGASPVRQQC